MASLKLAVFLVFFVMTSVAFSLPSQRARGFEEWIRSLSSGLSCGGQSYDPKTYICCNGWPNQKVDGKTQCCDMFSYNPEERMCCDKVLNYKTPGYKCCGTATYDPESFTCCNGVLRNLGTKCSTNSELLDAQDLNIERRWLTPCGYVSYNQKTHVCCAGKVLWKGINKYRCCGQVNYDPSSYVCCAGKVLWKGINKNRCCGQVNYDPEWHACCNGRLC